MARLRRDDVRLDSLALGRLDDYFAITPLDRHYPRLSKIFNSAGPELQREIMDIIARLMRAGRIESRLIDLTLLWQEIQDDPRYAMARRAKSKPAKKRIKPKPADSPPLPAASLPPAAPPPPVSPSLEAEHGVEAKA